MPARTTEVALDEALRQIEPRTLPQVVDFALAGC